MPAVCIHLRRWLALGVELRARVHGVRFVNAGVLLAPPMLDARTGPVGQNAADAVLRDGLIGCAACQVTRRSAAARALVVCGTCTRGAAGAVLSGLEARGWAVISRVIANYLFEKVPAAPFICLQWSETDRGRSTPSEVFARTIAYVGLCVSTNDLQDDANQRQTYLVPTYLRALLDVGTLVRALRKGSPRAPTWPAVLARAVEDVQMRKALDTVLSLAISGGGSAATLLTLTRAEEHVQRVGRPVRDFVLEAYAELTEDVAMADAAAKEAARARKAARTPR